MDMLIDKVNDMVRQRLTSMEIGHGDDFGLDRRAGREIYTDGDFIVVSVDDAKSLDYYGGFEYVDSEFVTTLGDFKVYSSDDKRVAEAIEYFQGAIEKLDEDEYEDC